MLVKKNWRQLGVITGSLVIQVRGHKTGARKITSRVVKRVMMTVSLSAIILFVDNLGLGA